MHMPSKTDIVGYISGHVLVCRNCAGPDEICESSEESRVTIQDVESAEEVWFCDKCGKRLY